MLSHSNRILNEVALETDGFYSNKLYYQDTDPLKIHMEYYEKLKEAGFIANNLRQAKMIVEQVVFAMDCF